VVDIDMRARQEAGTKPAEAANIRMPMRRKVVTVLALIVAAGAIYLYYLTSVCRVRVVTDPEYAGFKVKNPILWQMYLSSMMECKGGKVLVYPPNASDVSDPVLISDVRLVLERGDYAHEFVYGEGEFPIFTWQVDVDPGADEAIGFIAMRSAKRLTDEQIDEYGRLAVRQVLRTMLIPGPKRIQAEEGIATWFTGLRRMGIEMRFR